MEELTDRQKQIIDISIQIISEKGIQDLTMKNIAKELGVTEPAIYRHFESKQKILIMILDSFQYENKLINENLDYKDATAFQILQKSIKIIMEKLYKNPAMSAVIFSEEIFRNQSEFSGRVNTIMNSTISFFIQLLEKGQKDGSVRSDIGKEELGVIVMGSIRHIVTIWRLSGFSYDLNKNGKNIIKTFELLIAN